MRSIPPRHPFATVALAASLLLLVACHQPERAAEAPAPPEPAATVLAAYVLLAPPASGDGTPQPVARVIVDGAGASCPSLAGAGSPITTTARTNPDPTSFPVTVCEAAVTAGQALSVGGFTLPAAATNPTSLVVFGDTGCKTKECSSGPAEPFQTLSQAAAALDPAPGVVLHVGDYNYRGTGGFDYQGVPEYDAGDDADTDSECQLTSEYVSQNAGYSDVKDNWEDWRLDFFAPAAELLAAAPFVFARGNHELCSRAGPGWFYFLDPSGPASGTAQLACPPQDIEGSNGPQPPPNADGHIITRPPYTLDLGNLRVAVLDTANACDGFAPATTTAQYKGQLETLLGAVPGSPATWLLSHRPTWGAEGPANGECSDTTWETINASLQAALTQALAGNPLPAGLELAVAGHMHRFQSLAFTAGGRPPQLIVGDSGVQLDHDVDKPHQADHCAFTTTVDGEPVSGLELNLFGFLHLTGLGPSGGGWRAELVGESTTLACCQPGTVCAPGACPVG